MATNVEQIYDRMQKEINLEDLTDGVVEGWLTSGFTSRQTTHSGTVDLTQSHTITEWKDKAGGAKREKKVPGVRFTSKFDRLINELKSRKNRNVDIEVDSILQKESNRRLGRLPTDDDLKRLSERLEVFETAKPDVELLKKETIEFLEQDREFQRTLGETIAEQQDIAEADTEIVREELNESAEGRRQAIRALRRFAPQRLGGFTKAERRRGVEALAKLDRLF